MRDRGVTPGLGFRRSLGAGIFGGDGFRLQQVGGAGTFRRMPGGDVVEHRLAPGEATGVHPGHVGMFEDSVGFDITVLPGLRNTLFGGDGFFLARLTGPGRIRRQTLTVPNLVHALARCPGGETVGATAEGSAPGLAASSLIRRALGQARARRTPPRPPGG